MNRDEFKDYIPVLNIATLEPGDKVLFLDGEMESFPPVPRVETGYFRAVDEAQGLAEIMVPTRGHCALIEISDVRGVLRKGAHSPDAWVPLHQVQQILQREYNRSQKIHIDAGKGDRWRSEELHRCVCDTISVLMGEMRKLA